jgi:RsiW-degrading membrane proteinase PrsW (M82 family)
LLLSDRNAHFVLAEAQPQHGRWWRRFACNLGLPLAVWIILNVSETFLATDDTQPLWDAVIGWVMIVLVAILLVRAKYQRMQVRQAVMRELHQQRLAGNRSGEDEEALFLRLHAPDVRRAHATCSCFPNDVIYHTIADEDAEGQAGHMVVRPPTDCCTSLWNALKASCCGTLCCCWLQCCGMCAIGQEDRELETLLEPLVRQVDYITFQPYSDYYPDILRIRNAHDGNFLRHWQTLSQLSRNLITILITLLVLLTIVALLEIDPKFQVENLVVVLATFVQAFVILLGTHWLYNKFDLSLDALIKYFASGFVLCTFLAMVYELLVSTVVTVIAYIIILAQVSSTNPTTSEEVEKAINDFAKEHVPLFAVLVFVNAFVVAATVEELCKYFGYYMVETPDLMEPDELILESNANDSPEQNQNEPLPPNRRPHVSRGAGITVAMIAVAAGFACSENLLYVFVYTPPGLTNEIATLVARSMFPVHPLCAALQSVGVVRRDVEQDSKWQLGRILVPAVLLHGSFDFVLMLLALLESAKKTTADDDATMQDLDEADAMPLILSLSMVVLGLLYYCCASASQRKRLHELDRAASGADDGESRIL